MSEKQEPYQANWAILSPSESMSEENSNESFLDKYFKDKSDWIDIADISVYINHFLEVSIVESHYLEESYFIEVYNIELFRELIIRFPLPDTYEKFENTMKTLGIN